MIAADLIDARTAYQSVAGGAHGKLASAPDAITATRSSANASAGLVHSYDGSSDQFSCSLEFHI
jgi:hypothetical protein